MSSAWMIYQLNVETVLQLYSIRPVFLSEPFIASLENEGKV